MNFVGHAMAALWRRDDAGFVLGAMLPDLASMCGARLQHAEPEPLAEGVAFHHRTDSVFHGNPIFRALDVEGRAALEGSGVDRYVAMAAAHVGVELLLDGVWLDDPEVDAAYLRAIAHTEALPDSALRWGRPDQGTRFEALCERMRAWGSPTGYRDPDEVGRRLVRILSRRPRLAPQPGDEERIVDWTRAARRRVIEAAPQLRRQLHASLADDS